MKVDLYRTHVILVPYSVVRWLELAKTQHVYAKIGFRYRSNQRTSIFNLIIKPTLHLICPTCFYHSSCHSHIVYQSGVMPLDSAKQYVHGLGRTEKVQQ